MSFPTNSMYSTLGVTPILGRLPVAADESKVVVISHALWSAWFARDPNVIGKSYQVGDQQRTVIGVMGPDFRFPTDDTQLWISGELGAGDITETGNFDGNLVARMAPGATPEAVADELTALARRLPERFGGTPAYSRTIAQHRAIVRSLEQQFLGGVSGPLWVLLGAAAIVLLIACANVANLFLVRAGSRHQELAVRRALGAARTQLMRLQMAEALVLAAFAGVVAVVLAALILPSFLRAAPAGIPRLDQVSLSAGTLVFTLIMALVAAVLCGVLPALKGSAPDLTRMRDGGRASTRGRNWVRHGLVVGQTALALVLLIGSGLLLRSAHELSQVDPGYDTRDVFTFQIAPERPELNNAAAFARFNLAFLDRLAALPSVQSAGLVENVPLNEGTASLRVRTGEMGGDPSEGTILNYTYSAGDYFKTMGISVRSGRPFAAADHSTTLGNVVLSASAAKLLWPGQDPLGKRLQREGQTAWETVVGVVSDVKQDDFRETAQPLVYFPMVDTTPAGGRTISSPAYVIKTARAESIRADVRALVREVAPEAPMYRDFTMAGLAADSMVQVTFTLLTLGITALLALILGAVGLYGVLSYIVADRTREIGVRMALGAHPRSVRRMVVLEGARVVGAGVVIGVLAALAFTQVLGGLLFGVQPVDAATFTLMSIAMVGVGLIASYLPARRASRLDPMVSLRGE
jgi:predicted permease